MFVIRASTETLRRERNRVRNTLVINTVKHSLEQRDHHPLCLFLNGDCSFAEWMETTKKEWKDPLVLTKNPEILVVDQAIDAGRILSTADASENYMKGENTPSDFPPYPRKESSVVFLLNKDVTFNGT